MLTDVSAIAFAMLKGGTRKSTSAFMTAWAFAVGDSEVSGGEETLLIDADPYTQGATDWATQLHLDEHSIPFSVVQWAPRYGLLAPFVTQQIKETGAKRVVLDIGAELPEVVVQAARLVAATRGGMVISPVGAEQAELGRLDPTKTKIKEGGACMRVLLTRVPVVGKGVAKAVREVLTEDGYQVLPVEVPRNLARYADVFGMQPHDQGAYAELAAYLRNGAV